MGAQDWVHINRTRIRDNDWQHSLTIAYNKIAGIQAAQGQVAQALDSYKTSLSIMERLVKSDPSNAGWQYNLAVSYDLIGGLESKNNQLGEAAESYRAGLAIAERLAKSDPAIRMLCVFWGR